MKRNESFSSFNCDLSDDDSFEYELVLESQEKQIKESNSDFPKANDTLQHQKGLVIHKIDNKFDSLSSNKKNARYYKEFQDDEIKTVSRVLTF